MPKSYSQYKYEDFDALGLDLKIGLFTKNCPIKNPSEHLKQALEIYTKIPKTTDKAKAQFIIAPTLFDVARSNFETTSFFSGHNLDIDKNLGLKGSCDFLFTKTSYCPFIKDPLFCIKEAKNDNFEKTIPSCIAQMYAIRLSNEKQNIPTNIIYGCVTTGYLWKFFKLEKQTVYHDIPLYTLSNLPKILGILQFIVES